MKLRIVEKWDKEFMRKRMGVSSEKAKVYVEAWVQLFTCLRYFLVFMFDQFIIFLLLGDERG